MSCNNSKSSSKTSKKREETVILQTTSSHCTLMADSVRAAQPTRLSHLHQYTSRFLLNSIISAFSWSYESAGIITSLKQIEITFYSVEQYINVSSCTEHSLCTDKQYLFNILSDRVNAKLSDKKSLQKHPTLFFVYRTCQTCSTKTKLIIADQSQQTTITH